MADPELFLSQKIRIHTVLTADSMPGQPTDTVGLRSGLKVELLLCQALYSVFKLLKKPGINTQYKLFIHVIASSQTGSPPVALQGETL